jgi:hypothetical protein
MSVTEPQIALAIRTWATAIGATAIGATEI